MILSLGLVRFSIQNWQILIAGKLGNGCGFQVHFLPIAPSHPASFRPLMFGVRLIHSVLPVQSEEFRAESTISAEHLESSLCYMKTHGRPFWLIIEKTFLQNHINTIILSRQSLAPSLEYELARYAALTKPLGFVKFRHGKRPCFPTLSSGSSPTIKNKIPK